MYKKIFCNFLGLILAITAAANLALAQVDGGRGGGFQEKFFQVKRRQMGPELGVSQQTVDRLLQIEQRYQAMRQKLFQDSKADFSRLLQVMSQPSPSDREVTALLSSIKRHQQEKQNLQLGQGQEEEKLLTPVQQARKIMYQKRLLREARSIKGRGPRETPPFNPSAPREIQVSRKAGNDGISASAYQEKESTLIEQQNQLEKALGVNQQTVGQLLEIGKRYRPLRQQLIGEAKQEFQRLEQVMSRPNPSSQEVTNILNNIKKKEQEMQGLKQRQDEEEMAILSPVQQARYLICLIGQRRQLVKEPRSPGLPADGGVGTRPARNAASGRYPAAVPPPSPPQPAFR